MKQIVLLFLLLCLQTISVSAQTFDYPATRKEAVVDTFFQQHIVSDPYRWLENQYSKPVIDWVQEQNQLSKKYLAKASNKTNAFLAIDKYSYVGVPQNYTKAGKYYFRYFYYNNGGNPALYYKTQMSKDPSEDDLHPLVDPAHISSKDKIVLRDYSVSKNSDLLAYQFSRNGSDWAEVKVVELKNAVHRNDHLKDVKFSNLSWKGDGFFYAAYPEGKVQKLFYHKIGTSQSEDKLIYEANSLSTTLSFFTTTDERYFVLTVRNEQTGSKTFFYIDYDQAEPMLKPILANIKFAFNILGSVNGKFIAQTNHEANNWRLVEFDPKSPFNWREVVPESPDMLMDNTFLLKDRMIITYLSKGRPFLTVIDYSGKMLYKLELPIATTIGNITGSADEDEVLFRYYSYTFPTVVYKFNIRTFERTLTERTTVTYDLDNFEYKQVDYSGKDGTLVPMTLVYKKGIQLNGKNPTLLEAYGGFGAISQPSFSPGLIHFIKSGGVFAYASIRGGGELGSEWAMQGRGQNKQTSFDDYISAAEYLIKTGYTSSDKLAGTGASNGGLVVATAAIQRPELFKAVVPKVAPLDMLRFEKFTIGIFHTDEYGSTKDSLGFQLLSRYSPLHNIKENINYPSMLIMSSGNDDRVPPFHSYKFAAALQNRPSQKNPILLRIENNAGHNGATNMYSSVREEADAFAFIMDLLFE